MSGLTTPDHQWSHTPTVERRWWGRYFREVTVGDADDLIELEAAWEARCPEEAWLFEYVVSSGDTFTPSTLWPWISILRELLNSAGFEIDGGMIQLSTSPHRFLGRLAEGAPTVAAGLNLAPCHDPLRAGSIFVEALPLGANAELARMAFELLPPMPVDEPWPFLPTYDEPLKGELAEWVLDARALLEMLDLAPAHG